MKVTSEVTAEILAKALDERADRYMDELENAFGPHSIMNRDAIVERARLLVTCHDMWLDAQKTLIEPA
jgi:hypothetical protein